MSSFKNERLIENLRRELSFLIRNLKNLKDRAQNLSVSRLEILGKGTSFKVYISSIVGRVDVKFAMKQLNSAKGFIKRQISNKFKLKKSPEFDFVIDDFVDYGEHLELKFDQIRKENENLKINE